MSTNKRVALLLRGKSFNGQKIEEGVWESVGPFETAKIVGDYTLWAYTGSVSDFRWHIEPKSGSTIAKGDTNIKSPGVVHLETFYEDIEIAQKEAEAALKTFLKKQIYSMSTHLALLG